jgi:hypothetical protein
MEYYINIYIFGLGIFCGHILAGFCYADFTQYIVDKIESKIKNYFDEKRRIKKEAREKEEFNRILNNVYLRKKENKNENI